MKKLFVITCLFVVTKVSAQVPTDIFLFLGQSNMSGASPIGELDLAVLDNVYLFNSDNNWEHTTNTSTQGTNRYSTVRTGTNTLSPAYTFSKKLQAYTGKKIGIISNARSATTISWWQKGYEGENDYNLYEEAVARAKAALDATPGATIKGILWLQGEGDNGVEASSLYMGRLQQLISDLRTDLGDPTIPFIAGEIGKWNNRGLRVNPVIRSIKAHISYTDWVTSDGLMSKDLPNDDAHYDNLSQRTYGGRFADKALKLVYNYTLEGVTVYSENNYGGRSSLLGEGDYSSVDLESMGVQIEEIASLKTHVGYEIQFLSGSGSISSTVSNDRSELTITTVGSLRVVKKQDVFSNWLQQGNNYTYNFTGARAATYSNSFSLNGGPVNGSTASFSNTATPGWLPAPSSGHAYVLTHAHATYNGGYDLLPTASPNSLRIRITEGGPTKFSVMNAGGATEVARFATNIKFGPNGQKGTLRMALGNTKGTNAATAGVFIGSSNLSKDVAEARVFAALVFDYSATGITVTARRNKTGIGTTADIGYSTIKSDAFSLDGDYELEVFMNNSAFTQTYIYGSNNLSIAPRTYHVWINRGRLDLQGDINFPSDIEGIPELAINEPINAFGISHLGGATNQEANLTFSNIRFNYAASTLPVSITSFVAQKQNDAVKLNWTTSSEQNNSHFDVLRSLGGKEFHSIGRVSGAGNSNETRNYTFTDYKPISGVNYYKLKQVDFDASSIESEIQAVTTAFEKDEFIIYQERDDLVSSIYSKTAGNGIIKILDVAGALLLEKEVTLELGYTKVNLGSKYLNGIYVGTLTTENSSKFTKFFFRQ